MIEKLATRWAKKPRATKIWRWFSYLLTIAFIVYLAYLFIQGGFHFDQINWQVYWVTTLQALMLYLIALLLQFFVWARMMSFHRKINWKDVEIYTLTLLMRSLPGGAWHWIGRISLYSGTTEIPASVVMTANFVEWAMLTLCGAGLFLIVIPISKIFTISFALLLLAIAILLGARWQPAQHKWYVRAMEGAIWLTAFIAVWFLAAEILHIFVDATAGPDALTWIQAFQTWTFTGTIGMLVIMLPSSIGVREISLVWLLQNQLTPTSALFVALILRIIYTLYDIFWGLVGWLISAFILKQHRQVQSSHKNTPPTPQ